MADLRRTRARELRRRQTEAERRLWSRLRGRQVMGAKFRRQHPLGPYIVDFCCPEARLVIEIDGGQHAQQTRADAFRTRTIEELGYEVIRFWNNEVLAETDAVLECIERKLRARRAGPRPRVKGARRRP